MSEATTHAVTGAFGYSGQHIARRLLDVDAPSAGPTRLSQWAREHADTLGTRYASELARRRT